MIPFCLSLILHLISFHIPNTCCTAKLPNFLQGKIRSFDVPVDNETTVPVVRVGMYIENFAKFYPSEMSFDIDFYIYYNWKDPKLRHHSKDLKLVTNSTFLDSIWRPDLYLSNSKNAKFHDIVVVPNFSIFVDREGNVALSSRITAAITCTFELRNYPMDRSQECYLRIVSYAHIAKEVNVVWFLEDPIRYRNNIGMPGFSLEGVTSSYCNATYNYAITEESFKRDAFSCLQANIKLKRSAVYYIIQSYIPSAFIVITSSISFWLDGRAVLGRLILWSTTLLSIHTLSHGIKNDMPEVSCIKAIDIWFGCCFLFIFWTLIESAFVNNYTRKAETFERMAQSRASMTALSPDHPISSLKRLQRNFCRGEDLLSIKNLAVSDQIEKVCNAPSLRRELEVSNNYSRIASDIDQFNRFAFPLVFSAFNFTYWFYFLSQ